jgi:hypothetical protein
MVVIAVPPGQRDQRGEMVNRPLRVERERRAAVALGLGQALDDAFRIEPLRTLERERRAVPVAEQMLPASAIVRDDTDRGLEG